MAGGNGVAIGPRDQGGRTVTGAAAAILLLSGRAFAGYALCTVLSVTPYRDVVPVGMTFTVTAKVTNCGSTPPPNYRADEVSPSPLAIATYGGASVTVLDGPVPAGPLVIDMGASDSFSWICKAGGPGKVDVTVTVSGLGCCNTPQPPITNPQRTSSTSFIARGVELSATLYVSPPVAATGGKVVVEARIGNFGIMRADSLVPLSYTSTGCPAASEIGVAAYSGGSIWQESGPFPDCPASLDPGREMSFTWTFTAARRGFVDFAVDFSATAAGVPISISRTSAGGRLEIRDLCAQLHAVPDRVTEGQDGTILAQVTNCGLGFEPDIAPQTYTATGCALAGEIAVAPSGSAKLTMNSGPVPACAVSLNLADSSFFTWTFSTSISGSVDFTVTFTGMGAGAPPFPQASASARLGIQTPAKLSVTAWSTPAGTVLFKQSATIYLAITNIGEASADQVSPQPLTVTGTGELSPLPCPEGLPCPVDPLGASVTFIEGGLTRVFTWVYRASEPGYVVITSAAKGVDFNSRAAIVSPPAVLSLNIPDPHQLSITVTGSARLIQGQEFDVTAEVFNPASLKLCQYGLEAGGFRAFLNGSAEKVSVVSVDPPIPRCYESCAGCPGTELNCCRRVFTVTVRLADDAPLGAAELALAAAGYDANGVPIVSWSTALTLDVNSGRPGISRTGPNPYRVLRGGLVSVDYVVSPEQEGRPVALKVYTVSGELVATLVEGTLSAGMHTATWDGRNEKGETVASGMYLILFDARYGRDVAKLGVIK